MQHNIYHQFRQRLLCRLLVDLNGFEKAYCGRWGDYMAPLALLDVDRTVELDAAECTPNSVLEAIKQHYSTLKLLDKNLLLPSNDFSVWLCSRFKLSKVELRILTVLSLINTDSKVLDAIKDATQNDSRNMEMILAFLCECTEATLRKNFLVKSKLVTSKLVVINSDCEYLEGRYAVQKLLSHQLLSLCATKDSFLESLCRPIGRSDLKKSALLYMEDDHSIVTELLKARRTKATNVLLYGEPGVGKSELVKLLCQMTGRKGYEICFSSLGAGHDGERVKRIEMAQKLLDPNLLNFHLVKLKKCLSPKTTLVKRTL